MTQEPDVSGGETQTFGEEIIRWIETTCRVPEGVLIGQPIELMDWQRIAKQRLFPATYKPAPIGLLRG
jgi:hypothetical protein